MNVRRIREETEKIEKKLANNRFSSDDLLRYMQLKKLLRDRFGVKHFPLSDREWEELALREVGGSG